MSLAAAWITAVTTAGYPSPTLTSQDHHALDIIEGRAYVEGRSATNFLTKLAANWTKFTAKAQGKRWGIPATAVTPSAAFVANKRLDLAWSLALRNAWFT